jgi:hypothetical protein
MTGFEGIVAAAIVMQHRQMCSCVGIAPGNAMRSHRLILIGWEDNPMEVLSTITEIIRDLLIFVAAMTALLVVLILVIARMPRDNPLKRLLTALSYRIGATAAAGALAIPIEPIPGFDVLYDIGAPVLLLVYWISFFRNAGRTMFGPPAPRARPMPPTIDNLPRTPSVHDDRRR